MAQWFGYFEVDQELRCEECTNLISNCVACIRSDLCTLCSYPYQPSRIIDDYGQEHQVCLNAFCGLAGSGSTCADGPPESVSHCRKIEEFSSSRASHESCETCHNGYYRFLKQVVTSSGGDGRKIYDCAKQAGTIELDFFVRQESRDFFSSDVGREDMYDQLVEAGARGTKLNDPLYFL